MTENSNRPHLYKESDFADLLNQAGEVVGSVPKSWAGTDLIEPGFKVKAGRSSSSSSSTPATTTGDQVPAKTENREVLEKYAVDKAGLTEEQANAFANKDELHEAIVKAKA